MGAIIEIVYCYNAFRYNGEIVRGTPNLISTWSEKKCTTLKNRRLLNADPVCTGVIHKSLIHSVIHRKVLGGRGWNLGISLRPKYTSQTLGH